MTSFPHKIDCPSLVTIPLLVLIILLPLEAVRVGPTTVERLAVVMVLLTAAFLFLARPSLPFPPNRRWLLGFYYLLPLVIGVTGSVSGYMSMGGGLRWMPVFSALSQPLLTVSVFLILWHGRRANSVVTTFVLVGVGLAAVNVGQTVGILPELGYDEPPRVFGGIAFPFRRYSPVGVVGTFGVLAVTALGFLLARLRTMGGERPFGKILALSGVAIILLGILITQSRSTYLAVFMLFGTLGWLVSRPLIRYPFFLLAALLVAPFFAQTVDMFIQVNAANVFNRISTIQMAIDAFQRSPIWGIGWDIRALVNENDKVLHNSFLAILGYLGVAGALPFLTAYALSLVVAIRAYRMDSTGPNGWLFLGLALATTGWIVENMFYLGVRGYAIWILQGLLLHVATRADPDPGEISGSGFRLARPAYPAPMDDEGR